MHTTLGEINTLVRIINRIEGYNDINEYGYNTLTMEAPEGAYTLCTAYNAYRLEVNVGGSIGGRYVSPRLPAKEFKIWLQGYETALSRKKYG